MFSDLTWKKKNLLKEMVEGEGGRGGWWEAVDFQNQ